MRVPFYYIRQGTESGGRHRGMGGDSLKIGRKKAEQLGNGGFSEENKNLFLTMRVAKGTEADSGRAGRRNFANVKNNRMFNPLKI